MQVLTDIPEELIHAIKLPPKEIPTRLKRELAVRLYIKGLLNFGKARQFAGMMRWDFHDLLGTEGVVRRYDVNDLEDDLQTLEELSWS